MTKNELKKILKMAIVACVLFTSAVWTISCSSSGGGGVVTGPGTTASFASDSLSPGANTVTLQQGTVSGDTVNIVVKVTNVAAVNSAYGANIVLTYDATKVNWVSSTSHITGDFLAL